MTIDDKGEAGSASNGENGPLHGGKPIDPKRRDADPHPTEEAERRSDKVRSGSSGSEDDGQDGSER